jgi:hypothetical protein
MLSRLLLILISLAFWRKKPEQSVQDATASTGPEIARKVSQSDASHSREILKVLTLEREILGTALTTIYESEAQGIITRAERDRLIDKYSADLKELESKISVHQHAVDLFDLESAREELLRSFRQKLYEIDKKLAELRPGFRPSPPSITELKSERGAAPPEPPQPSVQTSAQPSVATMGSDFKDSAIGADKKIEAIRQEVLKAMERLEQIESEG